tara:strand:+ start:12728 stop:13189 length:462 start_codon:yes stop_codon:yes gene_type:complete
MMFLFRTLALMAIIAFGLSAPTPLHAEDDGIHRLALQISDNDAEKMNSVLSIAANVSRYYSSVGEEVEIRIIAFNEGMHMLRTDTAPEQIAKRVRGFSQSMPNVAFVGCGNTIDSMTRSEGKPPPVIEHSETVEAGVVELITLNEAGWTIVRP